MSAYKDDKTNKWYVFFYFEDWKGERKGKTKRGFQTKREALEWERDFLQKSTADLDMKFSSFFDIYEKDLKNRLRENTWLTKKAIIEKKILPYFKDRKMNAIKPADIINWQNHIMKKEGKNGKSYSPTYLKTIHNQLSAIFNHAVRFYDLNSNPARKAGNMGKGRAKEMLFWTKDEYLDFADVMMDKPISFYAFEMLYWCGIRTGELLALSKADFDLDKGIVKISKSYQRIKGKDVITDPKTEKSNRHIKMSEFLVGEMDEYMNLLYDLKDNDRLFTFTKSYLHHEMDRGSKASSVKRIRVHDLRHSHVSLLIEMGFSAVAIADRLGHESIDVTLRYAHMFPSKQTEMADKLDIERGIGDEEKYGQ